jgi:hypothetical protein
MVRSRTLLGAVLLVCHVNAATDYTTVCQDIAGQLSEASDVIYPSEYFAHLQLVLVRLPNSLTSSTSALHCRHPTLVSFFER